MRRWLPVLAGLAAAAGLILVVSGLSATRHDLLRARSALERARTAMASHDVTGARVSLGQAQRFLDDAASRARRPVLALLRQVPLVGSPVRALAAGARAGHEIVAAGRVLNDAAGSFPTSGEAGLDGHDLAAVHAAAGRSSAALADAGVRLAAARGALEGPLGAFLPQVSAPARSLAGTVDDARTQLASAGRGLRMLSRLTAPDADSRLLFLSQDSLELRATGGFIGSYGVLRFARGTAALERYQATEDLPPPVPRLPAPAELAGKVGYWDLSNVNWSPDFPTTARAAAEMFRRQGGGDVAGVVAVTERLMARLVGAVGPITLARYPGPVTERGFAERVLHEVELKRPLDNPRKQFLIDLSDEVFRRLFALAPDRLPVVLEAFAAAARAGDLQAWFAEPDWQADIAGTDVEGALPAPGGDFLLLADTNMTGSKANARLVRQVDYRVSAPAAGGLVATLEIDTANLGAKSIVNPYYNSFLRVYVPRGSQLVGDDAGEDTGEDTWIADAPDGPWSVISHRSFVSPGERTTVTFTYRLPDDLAPGGRYRLTWLRQPGTPADTLTAAIGGRSFSADPAVRRFEVTALLRGTGSGGGK